MKHAQIHGQGGLFRKGDVVAHKWTGVASRPREATPVLFLDFPILPRVGIGNEWKRCGHQGHAPDDGRGRGSVKRCSHRGVLSVRNLPDVQGDDSVRGVVIDDPGEVSWVLGQVAVR